MTPFVADTVSHRTRFAWVAAALAASFAAYATTRAAPEPQVYGAVPELQMPRCHKLRIAKPDAHALPAACLEYQQRLWTLSQCDQLPVEGRRALRDAWEQASTSWANLPADQQQHLVDGCRMASAALDEATTAMACTYYHRDRVLIAGPVAP